MAIPDADVSELERRLTDASRSWRDDFTAATITEFGEDVGSRLARTFEASFPEAYKEDFSAATGALDLGRLERLGEAGTDLSLFSPLDAARGEARLKVFRRGAPISLSRGAPGAVVDGRRGRRRAALPARPTSTTRPTSTSSACATRPACPTDMREAFQDTIRAVWDGYNEIDGFNALVLGAGLTWRQATVLRAYAKYMQQGNTPLRRRTTSRRRCAATPTSPACSSSSSRRASTRAATVSAPTRRPVRRGSRRSSTGSSARSTTSRASTTTGSCAPTSPTSGPRCAPTTSSSATTASTTPTCRSSSSRRRSPTCPQPRPRFEIFVYSPRVEGVHLRFGAVARGGLRWSDRRDDFRTEVLGLVKAQMVKNTVIVPVGAKGGFFCKQLPDPSDRDAWLAEGIACYKTFISGLLDITDNLVDGADRAAGGRRTPRRRRLLPRRRRRQGHRDVLRHRQRRRPRLRLLARRRLRLRRLGRLRPQGDGHHRPRRVGLGPAPLPRARRRLPDRRTSPASASATCPATSSATGCCCSEHTRLVAAFDHRDIFLDPTPDAGRVVRRAQAAVRSAAVELAGLRHVADLRGRRRLLPHRSSRSRSAPRSARSLGLEADVTAMTPAELMKAILQAPVDLLWNGGIGTYVKASDETHADAGDKANDAIRVDGARAARPVRRRGRQPRADPARPHRVRRLRRGPRRRSTGRRDQHRLHRQLRRRRHLRPRGQHQDPARPGRPRRRPHREAAQRTCSPR